MEANAAAAPQLHPPFRHSAPAAAKSLGGVICVRGGRNNVFLLPVPVLPTLHFLLALEARVTRRNVRGRARR